jgi:heat shock protein HslJ
MEPGPTVVGSWQWVQTLKSDETIVAADPSRYTITFNDDGTFSWQVDCNTGGGGFTTDGLQSISIGPGMMTMMGCPEDTQDFQFQQITNATIFFFMDGDLFFELADGAGIMQLTPVPPALTGTTWQWVQTITPVETMVSSNPASYTVLFNEDGTYALQADCNSGGGSYTVDGQSISIGPAAVTMMACPDGSQDAVFLQQLSNAAIYFFQGGDLYLDQAMDSGTMQFTAAQ